MPANPALVSLKAAIAEEAGDHVATEAALESIALTLLQNDLHNSEPLMAVFSAWQDSVISRVAHARLGIWHLNKRMSQSCHAPQESPILDRNPWPDTAAL